MAGDGQSGELGSDVVDRGMARRAFLRWATAVGGLASALLVGAPSLSALFWPAFRRAAPERWTKLGEAALFELDVPVRIDFSDTVNDAWVVSRIIRSVWLYTSDGEHFNVYNASCTHLGCGYGYDPESKTFFCPCHDGRFDVQTGVRLAGPPPRPLDRMKVKVEDGAVYVAYQDFRLGVSEAVPV